MPGTKVKCGSGIENDRRNRHLVLIDVENIAGTPCPTAADLAWVERQLQEVIGDLDHTQCVVACSHRAAHTVAFAFPRALRRWRSGVDGADLALLHEMSDLRVMQRFGRVTVCSGDGIFAESLATLAEAGVETTVVSLASSLSGRLEMSAQHVVALADNGTTDPTAEFGEAS
jgi:hypothetical protein